MLRQLVAVVRMFFGGRCQVCLRPTHCGRSLPENGPLEARVKRLIKALPAFTREKGMGRHTAASARDRPLRILGRQLSNGRRSCARPYSSIRTRFSVRVLPLV